MELNHERRSETKENIYREVEDSIAPEMIKYLEEEGKRWLHHICEEAWKKEVIPEDWENNLILPIYEKR